MRCEVARLEISARMDSEIDGTSALAVDRHLETCAECTAYAERLHDLRRSLRLQPVDDAPDIAGRVIAAIVDRHGPVERRKILNVRFRIAAIAAAAAAILLVSTVLPLDQTPTAVARADEIERAVTSAARSLSSYHARYTITERGWDRSVPLRSFAAEVWYQTPESFRLRVRDLTEYPSKAWPRNDVDLVSNPRTYWIREPYACPTEALPGCAAGSGVEQRSMVNRQPFDGTSDAPTDIVVPLESVARSEGLQPIGAGTINGRAAQHVRLTYREAHPLVDALQAGGSWAPIAPLDRVDIWLDAETWFPLRFEVADGGRTILEVNADFVEEPDSLSPALFQAPRQGVVTDGGFVKRSALQHGGYVTLSPTYVAGLKPYRAGVIKGGPTVLSYSSGMTWLKVMVDDPMPPTLATQLQAEVVELSDGGRALYLPADGELERRLDIDDGALHFHLESNLPRAELLRVGSSLRGEGVVADELAVEGGTLRRLPESMPAIDFAKEPTFLPSGYHSTGAFLRTGRLATLIERFGLPESDLGASGIQIDQSPSVPTLTPSSEDLFGVRVGDALARWSPERGQLEWIDAGVYRSITAPSFDLASVVAIARGMR
jgi:outer membrane lipoprotein-sorting protein